NGTGYLLTGLTGEKTIIRIEPTTSIHVGWGRAFGFYETTNGCNSKENKAKLLSIINDRIMHTWRVKHLQEKVSEDINILNVLI
ncbi:MAG: hypothetical protein LUD74_03990, partial [Tannerellaceae bacterium]|nr:hypothetical protein [Tannerellaceae bacterium]